MRRSVQASHAIRRLFAARLAPMAILLELPMRGELRALEPSIGAGSPSVRIALPGELDARTVDAWRRLAERALEPNAYLAPMFVLPALMHLEAARRVTVFLIEQEGQLIGVGVFSTRRLPAPLRLRVLEGFRSRHSYLSGLLVDHEYAPGAVDAFFSFIVRREMGWHGVRFDWMVAGSHLEQLLRCSARRRGIWWSPSERFCRAVLRPPGNDGCPPLERIAASRLKDLRRRMRRLGEQGDLAWRVHFGCEISDEVVERFLRLEHGGWKGEAGSSLRSSPANERFFVAMIDNFRACGGVFFTELAVGGQVIASTCNLVSAGRAFAFKIGWDPAFARYSPGMLSELLMVEHAASAFAHFDRIDSGAAEGTYIDELWPDRQEMVSGVFATTFVGKLLYAAAAARRQLSRAIASWCSALRGTFGKMGA